jgi:protein-L-isoaspartate(D-aspartate) O-methyltransferase
MVIPVDDNASQKMMRITKNAEGGLEEETFSDFSFVPMLKGRS